MDSLEWKGIASCPRVHGKPVLLYEPGFGMQVGQWDMRRMSFVSGSAAFNASIRKGLAPTVDDLFAMVPVKATKWADVDLGDPSLEEADKVPPMTPRSYPRAKPTLKVIEGGSAA